MFNVDNCGMNWMVLSMSYHPYSNLIGKNIIINKLYSVLWRWFSSGVLSVLGAWHVYLRAFSWEFFRCEVRTQIREWLKIIKKKRILKILGVKIDFFKMFSYIGNVFFDDLVNKSVYAGSIKDEVRRFETQIFRLT